MTSRRSLLALALLAACNLPDLSKVREVTGLSPEASEPGGVEDTGLPPAMTVRVRAVGPNGVIPYEVVVRATEALFDAQEIDGPLPDGNLATISPEVAGSWRVHGVDEVVFTPDAPFAPDTKYTVDVRALGSGERLKKPGNGPWTGAFTTPAFAFQRVVLRERDATAARVTMEVVFTGPVEPDDVAGKVSFTLGDQPVRPSSRAQGRSPNAVQFTFVGRSFIQDVPLNVAVAPGVRMVGVADVAGPAGQGKLDLAAAPPIEIHAASIKEGASGWYVDVVCDDEAGGDDRYYWDRETYDSWYVSERCLPSQDEVARAISFDPGVEFSVAPGPAGFRLFGDFARGELTMTIDAGLRTEDGGMLPDAYEAVFTVPERTAKVSFTSKGRYLPRDAWDDLPIRSVNVDAVELTVRHVPEENLVFWMGGDEPATARTSTVVLKKRIPVRKVADDEVTTWVDLDGLMPRAGRGVYELKIRGIDTAKEAEKAAAEAADTGGDDVQDTGWAAWHRDDTPQEDGPTDFSRLLVTDLQIVAKLAAAGPEQHYAPRATVWALGTHDGQPVSGAEVKVVRPSGQVLGSCRTDFSGSCTADLAADPNDETAPMAVIVRKDDDLSYLKFTDLEVAPPADTMGLPYLDEQPYRAAVWTERGVYRPGDTAHLAAIVRGDTHVAPPASLPVVAKLVDPRGKELRKKVVQTNAAGVLAVDWTFGDYATTGMWKSILEAGDQPIGEVSFAVEEFVPERMKVDAGIEGQFLADEEVPVAISARWLFGGNAGGSEVELACQIVPGGFTPKENRNFAYGLATIDDGTERRTVTIGTLSERLDDEGRLTLSCPPAARSGGFLGAATLVAQAAVFEGDSGRTTLGEARAPIHPEKFYVGLSTGAGKVGAGDAFAVSGVVVDWDGKVAPDAAQTVKIELQRLEEEYVYTWDRAEQRYRYRRMLRRSQEDVVEVPASGGRFSASLTPQQTSSGYLVVATSGNARSELYVEGKGYRYWWWGDETTVDATPRPAKPGELTITAPETAEVKDRVTVKTTVPYAGRLLWTVETHEVLESQWVAVQAGEVEWSFSAKDFVPNVYVGALLVKDPHLESAEAYMPDRAYGARSVALRPAKYVQTVKLDTPREVRPYGPLEVGIDLGPQDGPSFVTVAAVDEGILSLTDFESPDPFESIFAQRALGVDTFETVGWTLLVPPGGPGRTTGGDGDLAGGGRVQMVKPVALWSGVVEVPASGKTTVRFDVPGYRGELRVMAVSASATKMGWADAQVTVKDPIVLQTTLPRFLVAGDEAVLPVFVSNVSGAARDIVVDLSVEDLQDADEAVSTALGGDRPSPVVVTSERQARLRLEDGASDTVLFKVKAQRAPDAAKFRVVASADALQSLEEIELPVMRPEPEVRETARVSLVAGSNDLTQALSPWVDGSDRTRIWVTANPYGPALSHVREMVRYPYGCIEQTTSSTRPLLYVSTLLDSIDPALAKEQPVDKMVRHGIERILSMQTSQGGFAYWPGGGSPTEWGTAYATHLLLDAKEAGYAVPDRALSDALDWLGRQVDRKGGTSVDDYTLAYEHYVLARGGRARTAQVQTLLENLAGRTGGRWTSYRELHEPRYLMMAAMYLGGDRRYEAELKKPDTSDLTNVRHNSWSFYSDLRSRGFELSVYHDLFGSTGAEGEKLATIVGNGLSTQRSSWYTTQEMSWGLTGLGKWVGSDAADVGKASLFVDGQEIRGETVQRKGGSEVVWTVTGASAAGALTLDVARSSRPLYAVISVQGVRTDAPVSESEGLWVGRELLGSDGSALSGEHDLGTAMFVRVAIRNNTKTTQQNVALVDRLPAGFEIENPRLGRGGSTPEWLDTDSLWGIEHMNLRDDRVEVFGTLEPGETRFVVYQVRAVTGGTFTHPPVTAEVMYDPKVRAKSAPSKIVVRDPWSGS